MVRLNPHALDQRGFTHRFLAIGLTFVVIFSSLMTFRSVSSHAAAIDLTVSSGIKGYCLDVHNDSQKPNTIVDSWDCNKSQAQQWHIAYSTIKHASNECLSVYKNGTLVGTSIVLNQCNDAPGQVWLRDNNGFFNPNSSMCLSMPPQATNQPLILDSCNNISKPFETWLSAQSNSCDTLDNGDRIACSAIHEWTSWQAVGSSHPTLLTIYTDGASYEEWCADFVSYVFKEAAHPFKNGETNGWDENLANNVQYQGFTKHEAGNYVPKTGDVAYFDYQGGHVEVVVSGGTTPSFVYGNSADVDPSTGNGQMKANTITSDGSEGSVQYYLSPSFQ